MLEDRATCGKFAMAVGSTDVHDGSYLFNDSNIPETCVTGQMLDDVMVSATHATPLKVLMRRICPNYGELIWKLPSEPWM